MSYPRTAEEWWAFAEEYRKELRDLVRTFHPSYGRRHRLMEVSAPAAEVACERVRQEIAEEHWEDPLAKFDDCLARRDGIPLLLLLSQTWFGLPESMASRDLPGFAVLCDMCSEGGECLGAEFEE